MSDGPSISAEAAGIKLSARDRLPTEINRNTDMGEFTKSVLSLIEERTGVPVGDPSKLFDFSTVREAYGIPIVGISKDGQWVITGHKDHVDKRDSQRYTMTDVPEISIKISKIKGISHEGKTQISTALVPDNEAGSLEVKLLGDSESDYKGWVQYRRPANNELAIDVASAGDALVTQEPYTAEDRENKMVMLKGNPPGIKRGRLNVLASNVRSKAYDTAKLVHYDFAQANLKSKVAEKVVGMKALKQIEEGEAARAVPEVIGWFIDQLPPKSAWEVPPKGTNAERAYIERTGASRVSSAEPAVKN